MNLVIIKKTLFQLNFNISTFIAKSRHTNLCKRQNIESKDDYSIVLNNLLKQISIKIKIFKNKK